MKRIFFFLPLCALGFMCAHATPTAEALEKLINAVDPNTNIGIQVLDLTTNTTLFERAANRLLIPASNMKLFSSAASLIALGPDYRFNNQLSVAASKIENHTLYGNVILHLPGDPSFDQQQLMQLLHALPAWDIDTIKGDVIIDSQLSSVRPYAPGWMKEDLAYAYGAPLAPLLLDQNRILITINPAGKHGKSAIIEQNFPYKIKTIKNDVRTYEQKKPCSVSFSIDKNNSVSVSGCIKQGQGAKQQKIAIVNPLQHAQQSILADLKSLHISLKGTIRLGSAPKESLLIAETTSEPISELIAQALKSSDNLYADALFLHTAAFIKGKALNWRQAKATIETFLQQAVAPNMKDAIIVDGSGLSRRSRLSALQTVSLLRFLHQNFALSYEFIVALPVSGRDGTLQERLDDPQQRGRIRAKTGTMKGIISLSGFLDTQNDHTLAFAMYINARPNTPITATRRYRWLIDTICEHLLQLQPPGMTNASPGLKQAKLLRFQAQTSQAKKEQQRSKYWRTLEAKIKKTTMKKELTVLYRPQEIVIKDSLPNAISLATALKKLYQDAPFSLILSSQEPLNFPYPLPMLWIKTKAGTHKSATQRVWTLRPIAKV